MKNFITRYSAFIIIALMLAMLLPGVTGRIASEGRNNNITLSVLYDDLEQKVSGSKIAEQLDLYKSIGVDNVSVKEEDLNSLYVMGEISCLKYNTLCQKYNAEDAALASFIAEKYPDISQNSFVVVAARDETKQKLAYLLPRRFSEKDYADIGEFNNSHVYVFHDGKKQLWDFAFGYDERLLEELSAKGFNISLVFKVKNYASLDYLEDLDRIVKKYDVEYLNLKKDNTIPPAGEAIPGNYEGIAKIINENNMTLVVTENTNQLSNQMFLGYTHVFGEVMKEGGSNKVVRSYETYDDSQIDSTNYRHRVEQFFNSTIDRNLRFLTVTQIVPDNATYNEGADFTLAATKEYKEKIEAEGFRVNGETLPFDYNANTKRAAAACAVIVIMCLLLMYQTAFGKKSFALTLTAIILSAAAFLLTFKLPDSLTSLYPTVFCVIQACTAMTALLYFIKKKKDSLPLPALLAGSVVVLLAVLLLGSCGMGAMLSGVDYYINNLIFRGIKISLIVPVLYTAVLYYIMFIKSADSGFIGDMKKVLNARIKVYWLLIAGAIAGAGIYYIIRSGNVTEISSMEHALRAALTEAFSARPRTKEFLIGYPALILFVYYMKRIDVPLIRWLLAVAASILAASVTNSFCHVFTDFTTILARIFNGLILGIAVSAAAYIANIAVIKILRALRKRLDY